MVGIRSLSELQNDNAMLKMKYLRSQGDHTVFIKHSTYGKVMALIVYVVATEDDLEEIEWLKERLATEFDIKDLRRLRYFLGIEVDHIQIRASLFHSKT